MTGIYIHIPFCASRCIYCSFFSTMQHASRQRYVDCVCRELASRGPQFSGCGPYTVYFGGGTPSQLSAGQINDIFSAICKITGNSPVTEFTVECNPDDITSQYVRQLADIGVNRISMGVQTFNDGLLRFLGRRHNAERAVQAVSDCKKAGISNISIDLMYGLPGQTADIQQNDLETATSLGVQHISSYCLSFEEGSRLFRMRRQGLVKEADEDNCLDMYMRMCDHLTAHGFTHYEISNFSLPGYHSRHNSLYWDGSRYLGIGAGAHSFDGNRRLWNPCSLDSYMNGIENGHDILEFETLSITDKQNEHVLLGLRTAEGISLKGFMDRFGKGPLERLEKAAAPFIEKGRLVASGDRLFIPRQFMFVSDGIISELFVTD